MSPAVCTQLYNYRHPGLFSYHLNLAFTISARVIGGWVTGKILQMEMAVHTLCSVQCGGLHQVVNEAEVEVWRVSLLEICSLHIHTLTHTHTLELFRLDNFWGVGGDVWRWLCRHLHQKIWHMSMRGWAEGLPCADPGYEPPFVEIISIVSYWFEGGGWWGGSD